MDLMRAGKISAAGMKVQGTRLKVIAENIANADSMAAVKGGDPWKFGTSTSIKPSFGNSMTLDIPPQTRMAI